MRTKRFSLLLGVAVAVLLSVPLGNQAFGNDRHPCTLGTLHGLYVFRASGFIVPASGPALPKAIVEVIRFNGDGTVEVPAATVSLNGVIVVSPPGGTGTYTVADLVSEDRACSGTLTFAASPVSPSFNLVIPLRGDTIWLIQTNPNNVFEGTATKVAR
jgi:hypothetical protein